MMAVAAYKVLHQFSVGEGEGLIPLAGLVFDGTGNLYGTTSDGGDFGRGTVFQLSPNATGGWTQSIVYSFAGGTDGGYPFFGVLILDSAGNLYGTTTAGGDLDCNFPYGGCGVVFELTPSSGGKWIETVLHSFSSGADGAIPYGGLIFDTSGNLYGTTIGGGGSTNCGGGCGTVFRLTPNTNRTWTESVLHSFTGGTDGYGPYAGLIVDSTGNLYGTTPAGGVGSGTVFTLPPNSGGSWRKSVLYNFSGFADGAVPYGGLVFDKAGNIYGTTAYGGRNQSGVVFELTPNSQGTWIESVLHTFTNNPGANPLAGLVFDAMGNLYGTAYQGGPANGGLAFKLTPNSNGNWKYSVQHAFLGNPALHPYDSLVLDNVGNIYGTTHDCDSGYNCYGVVFEITP
jgi:uncharacterized repeat protein (TIGR03803 family)